MLWSAFWINPETISPFLSLNSLNIMSLSASLSFWIITCFAVCAAILPKSLGTISTYTVSPSPRSGFIF